MIDKTSHIPLYQQVRKAIEDRVKSGKLKPGDIIESEKALCKIYNVSQITIRKAISDLVNMGVLYRVPGKGTFLSSLSEKSRVPFLLKTNNIGFVIRREHHPAFSNPFYSFVFRGVESEARARGYNLFYQLLDHNIIDDTANFKLVNENKVDGLLLVGEMPHAFISDIKDKGIPLVLIDHYINDLGLDAVVTENEKGAYQIVKYLIDLGHRKIGFWGASLDHGTFMERFKGYKRALSDYGIKFSENLVETVLLIENDIIVDKMFEPDNMPTAVLACNDLVAIKVMSALQDKGLKIPDDISIAGFDDIELGSQIRPPLTTVRVQREQMGVLAVKKLINNIERKNNKCEKTVLTTELVVRQSCKAV
ncbi:MAG: GntR family transcriptional regulator [bacterium]|nr:GntR family transcriptional regulator [bacterium]